MSDLSPPESSIAAVEIALDLDRDAVSNALGFAFDRLGEPRISLIQCFAVTRHLHSIVGAVARSLSRRPLRRVWIASRVYPAGYSAARSSSIVAQPAAELVRLQGKLLAAIGPGLAPSDSFLIVQSKPIGDEVEEASLAAIRGFIPNGALPTFMPYVNVDDLQAFPIQSGGLSLYELGRSAVPRRLIWHWTTS